ncbi:hypothetical protein K456DRAFT_1729014, partial [Colletotrichum gloeosporioides 23]
PDLGSCSGKAGDLGWALARDITSPLPSGGASVALELGLRRASSQGCNVVLARALMVFWVCLLNLDRLWVVSVF